MNCPFCQIIAGEKPAKKVYEDEEIVAFHDTRHVAPVHILIIPKKHITNLAGATEEDIRVLGKIQFLSRKIAEEMGVADGFRLASASGSKVGQTVFHLHYHLIGGWEGKAPRIWE